MINSEKERCFMEKMTLRPHELQQRWQLQPKEIFRLVKSRVLPCYTDAENADPRTLAREITYQEFQDAIKFPEGLPATRRVKSIGDGLALKHIPGKVPGGISCYVPDQLGRQQYESLFFNLPDVQRVEKEHDLLPEENPAIAIPDEKEEREIIAALVDKMVRDNVGWGRAVKKKDLTAMLSFGNRDDIPDTVNKQLTRAVKKGKSRISEIRHGEYEELESKAQKIYNKLMS